jgi:uncharacterized protein involved in exopolysaccharide biosynthesis
LEAVKPQIPEPIDDELQYAPSTVAPPSLGEIMAVFLKNWLFVAKTVVIGILITAAIAFLIPNEYTSTAQLMRPDPQTFNNPSGLNALTGASLLGASLGGGGLLNQQTPGGTAIAVLSSTTVLDDIINRFDLRKVYHYKFYADTRKKLLKNSTFTEDKKSGNITISVADRDRSRAQGIVQLYIEDLNKLINTNSTSSGRRERVFLEERLKSIKDDLDSNSRALSQFSSHNQTIDIQRQGEATLGAAERLQGQLASAQVELSVLKGAYTDDSVPVKDAQDRINELQRQIRKITGSSQDLNAANSASGESMPSIRALPILGVTYYDLYRKVTMQGAIYETLTKQYELAKVREAEEIPRIVVLDPADLPEKKSFPHRSLILLAGGAFSLIGACVWILMYERKFIFAGHNMSNQSLRER